MLTRSGLYVDKPGSVGRQGMSRQCLVGISPGLIRPGLYVDKVWSVS